MVGGAVKGMETLILTGLLVRGWMDCGGGMLAVEPLRVLAWTPGKDFCVDMPEAVLLSLMVVLHLSIRRS